MEDKQKKSVRRLKKQFRGNELAICRQQIMKLKSEIAELKEQISGGWISPDDQYCDTKYAARMVNKREQTLRNLRSTGGGPKAYPKSGSIYYDVADLHDYIRDGKTTWPSEEDK